jgi:DNA polymerase Ligase (LigD)
MASLEHWSFEGTIPKGEYEAGTVEIWDEGTYGLLERTDDPLGPWFMGIVLSGRTRRWWRVGWEAGLFEWAVLPTLGECTWLSELDLKHEHRLEVLLQSGRGWYSEPWYRFDVGFVERWGQLPWHRVPA